MDTSPAEIAPIATMPMETMPWVTTPMATTPWAEMPIATKPWAPTPTDTIRRREGCLGISGFTGSPLVKAFIVASAPLIGKRQPVALTPEKTPIIPVGRGGLVKEAGFLPEPG